MPLFVRAGSIIPMGPDLQYAAEKPADPIELRVYRGADGAFTLYEDENDGYNYEKGVSTRPSRSRGMRRRRHSPSASAKDRSRECCRAGHSRSCL